MQKIAIDTNVIVSSLIGSGYSQRIIFDLVFGKKVIVFISMETYSEYVNVLSRERFKKYPEFVTKAEIVLNKIEELALNFTTSTKYEIIKDDADNRFLELAVDAHADFLITGNSNDFTISEFQGLKIVNPNEYINRYYR